MRLYKILLRLYPTSFRAEHEAEMCAIFARRPGAVLDLLLTAAQVHWDILFLFSVAATSANPIRETRPLWRWSASPLCASTGPAMIPVGRRVRFAGAIRTVIGVVGDTRERGFEVRSEPQIYLSHQQVPDKWYTWFAPKDLVLRTSGDPAKLLPAIRRIVAKADPQQPISDVQMLNDIVEAETAPRRVQWRVLGAFTAVAFLLAGIGIHGLLSFTVSQRAQESGVRVALGAEPKDILRLVLREGVLLGTIGIALGGALAYAAGRSMEVLLAGVNPGDVTTFASAILVALLMTVAGSLWPALRALRMDPVTTIRAE